MDSVLLCVEEQSISSPNSEAVRMLNPMATTFQPTETLNDEQVDVEGNNVMLEDRTRSRMRLTVLNMRN